MNEEKQKLLK